MKAFRDHVLRTFSVDFQSRFWVQFYRITVELSRYSKFISEKTSVTCKREGTDESRVKDSCSIYSRKSLRYKNIDDPNSRIWPFVLPTLLYNPCINGTQLTNKIF